MSTFIAFVAELCDHKRCPTCERISGVTFDYPKAVSAYIKRFAGDEVEVEIRKRRTKRSDKQNRALHALLTPWSHGEGYPMDELKRDLLIAVWGSTEATSPITGEVVLVPTKPHTSTLTTAEFAELMDRSVEIAAGCGVILELPDEFKTRKAKEAKHAAKRTRAAT